MSDSESEVETHSEGEDWADWNLEQNWDTLADLIRTEEAELQDSLEQVWKRSVSPNSDEEELARDTHQERSRRQHLTRTPVHDPSTVPPGRHQVTLATVFGLLLITTVIAAQYSLVRLL